MIDMDVVTLSPKFQVVIPKAVRETLGLAPGQKLRVFRHGEHLELIPVRRAKELRGLLKGLDTTIDRDDDRV
jgi:AbrB family looped-hinge helix DNA binding protein